MDTLIVEIATAVANDFVDRPSYFTDVSDAVAQIIEDLWYRTGSDPDYPDRLKRAAMFGAVFGACDCASATGQQQQQTAQFGTARDAVLEAAVRYTQRTFDEGRQSLLRAFRDRLISLREYLTTFEGTPVRRFYTQTSRMFGACINVLTHPEIARAYGLPPAPRSDKWPLGGEYSGQGAQLIEAIAEKVMPAASELITRRQVLATQRVAFDGVRTLTGALTEDLESDDKVEALIPTAFTWWTALQDAKPTNSEPQATKPASSNAGPELAVVRSSIKPLR